MKRDTSNPIKQNAHLKKVTDGGQEERIGYEGKKHTWQNQKTFNQVMKTKECKACVDQKKHTW